MQEVIEETAIADRVPLTTLVAVGKEAERLQRVFDRVGTLHPAALDCDGIGRQGKAHRSDAAGNARDGGVRDQPVFGIVVFRKIIECALLKPVDQRGIRFLGPL